MTQRHMHANQAAASERRTRAQKKKGILSQLSMPAVVAAALTSMTSFMLSSKLGLTGSLIGAALVSAVSTIASQLYNAMINRSVDRIHDLSDQLHTKVFDRLDAEVLPVTPHPTNNAVRVLRGSFAVAMIAAVLALVAYSEVVDVATQGQGIGPNLTAQAQQSVEEHDAAKTDEAAKADEAEKAAEEAADDESAKQDAADALVDEKTDSVAGDVTPADGLLADSSDDQGAEAGVQDTDQSAGDMTEAPSEAEPESPAPSAEANKDADAADMSATV